MQHLDPTKTRHQQPASLKSMIDLPDLGVEFPVLPLGWKLEVIKGKILAINKQIACADFSFNAYVPYEYVHERDQHLASQDNLNTALAFITRPAKDVEKNIDDVIGYSPSLNFDSHFIYAEISGYEGKLIRGWVGITPAYVGDWFEMVVQWRGDHYEPYAFLLPEKRIVSIYPECHRGSNAYRQFSLLDTLFSSVLFTFTMTILIGGVTFFIDNTMFTIKFILETLLLGTLGLLIISALMRPSANKAINQTSVLTAERIFLQLGPPMSHYLSTDNLIMIRTDK